jgi:hypothetical protein
MGLGNIPSLMMCSLVIFSLQPPSDSAQHVINFIVEEVVGQQMTKSELKPAHEHHPSIPKTSSELLRLQIRDRSSQRRVEDCELGAQAPNLITPYSLRALPYLSVVAFADFTTLVLIALLFDLGLQCCVRVAEHGNRRNYPSSSRHGFRFARPD